MMVRVLVHLQLGKSSKVKSVFNLFTEKRPQSTKSEPPLRRLSVNLGLPPHPGVIGCFGAPAASPGSSSFKLAPEIWEAVIVVKLVGATVKWTLQIYCDSYLGFILRPITTTST